MKSEDILDNMFECLCAIYKTAAFSEIKDFNPELAEDIEKLISEYLELNRLNPKE